MVRLSKEEFLAKQSFQEGQLVDAYDLIKLVEKIHYPQMDLEDGDLCDRIWEYQTYRLQRIPISSVIDRNDYTLDEERWISFEAEDPTTFPPIVVHPTIKEGDYHVVDGCHRLAHQNSKGHVEVLAFIGHERCVC